MKGIELYKKIASIVLLVAFLIQLFSNQFIIASYYINKQAYLKNCVNKYRPQLKCNGQCQLMKKLKKEEKKDQEYPERKGEIKEIFMYKEPVTATIHTINDNSDSKKGLGNQNLVFSPGFLAGVFHPPQFS